MNTKIITRALLGFVAGIALAWVAVLVRIATLGSQVWQGDIKVLFVPVAHIENSPEGFTLVNSWGMLVIGLLGALVAVLVSLRVSRSSDSD